MPDDYRKCTELLSVIAIKHEIYLTYALLIGAHTKTRLDNVSYSADRHALSQEQVSHSHSEAGINRREKQALAGAS
jgi:hypothetical protein